jgi:Fe(3+) dicitrate transport protein
MWDFEGYLTGSYVAPMREEAGQGDDGLLTDAQLLLDANFSYAFESGWKATLKGENLTGNDALASRRPFGARPVRPRLVMAGVNYSF